MDATPNDLLTRLAAVLDAQQAELGAIEQARKSELSDQADLVRTLSKARNLNGVQREAAAVVKEQHTGAELAFKTSVAERRDILDQAGRDVATLAALLAVQTASLVADETG